MVGEMYGLGGALLNSIPIVKMSIFRIKKSVQSA